VIVEGASLSGATPCDCRAKGRASRLEERAQIPPLYQRTSFENFEAEVPGNNNATRELKGVVVAVKKFANHFPDESRPGLLISGKPGTGKTHLAVAVMRQLIEKGHECQFCDYQTLLNSIKSSYDPLSNSSDKEAYRMALDAEVLVLDDLGAHRVTDWVEDTVTSIITHRCNNRKALIATTNLPIPDVGDPAHVKSALGRPEYLTTLSDRIGPRGYSRLFEMCTVVRMLQTDDYRLRKARTF
jgi:DNA replication protein DnaC